MPGKPEPQLWALKAVYDQVQKLLDQSEKSISQQTVRLQIIGGDMADVIRITALSRTTLYRRIAEGKFPPPVHLGGRACGWTPTALQA